MDLPTTARTAAELGAQLAAAVDAGDVDAMADLHHRLRAAEARRDQLLGAAPSPVAGLQAGAGAFTRRTPAETQRTTRRRRRGVAGEMPLREAVLDVLTLLERPASSGLVNDVLRARGRIPFDPRRVASLRRDEEASWTSSATRSAYVVPALSASRMTPVRGVLASSVWPLSVRIQATASGRVDFLHAVAALAGLAERDQASPLEQVLWKLARTIPDAVNGGLEPARVRAAALRELSVHEAADDEERQAAAERAQAQLDPRQQLFGAKPRVIRNERREA